MSRSLVEEEEYDRHVAEMEARMASMASAGHFHELLASRAAGPYASPPAAARRRLAADTDAADVLASTAFTTPPPRRSLARTAAAGTSASSSAWLPRGSSAVVAEASRPPDMVLHVDACAFALHSRVLRQRCCWLHEKLQLLLVGAPAALVDTDPVLLRQTFQLRLLSSGVDEGKTQDGDAEVAAALAGDGVCPLANLAVAHGAEPPWLYTRCASHWDANRRLHEPPPPPPELLDHVKTEAGHAAAQDADYSSPPRHSGKRKRRADGPEPHRQLAAATAASLRRPGVAHFRLLGSRPECMATCVEYVYVKKARLVRERYAEETARLCEWLGMRGQFVMYRCLRVAAAHVTPRNWMALVCMTVKMSDLGRRYVVLNQLATYLSTIGLEHHVEFAEHSRMADISVIRDRATLIAVVGALVNHMNALSVWWDLFFALDAWLFQRGPESEAPLSPSPPGTKKSLLTLTRHYAPWEPVWTISELEFFHKARTRPTFATLVEFGWFALQVRFEHAGSVPILWRVIKTSAPEFDTGEPVELDEDSQELRGDPHFCIRGQLNVKYPRPGQPDHVVEDEVLVEYEHCAREYGVWLPLVSADSPSGELVPASGEWWSGEPDEGGTWGAPPRKTVAKMLGTVFIWGDKLCNLYHRLLVSSLFYGPPPGSLKPGDPTPEADAWVVDQMRSLPFETLVLALLSDRLRIPGGETTLVRLLTLMAFTRPDRAEDAGNAGNAGRRWRGYNGHAHEVVALFRCVRWCFVHLRQILTTLAKSPRRLRLYELIQDGLKHSHLRFRRESPWGWKGDQPAYASNTTNIVDFEIEAGDKALSPSQFEDEDAEAEDAEAEDADGPDDGSDDGGGCGRSPVPSFPPELPGVR